MRRHCNVCSKLLLDEETLQGIYASWWRHQIETFSTLLAICVGNSSVTGEFPAQRPVTWSFDVSFDLSLNERLGKQSWGWWFETPSHPLWRHSNVNSTGRTNSSWVLKHMWAYLGTFSVVKIYITWTVLPNNWNYNLHGGDCDGTDHHHCIALHVTCWFVY